MTPSDLRERLRQHAHDLVNGGTNATDLRNDLNAAASLLASWETQQAALREGLALLAVLRNRLYGNTEMCAELDRIAAALSPSSEARGTDPFQDAESRLLRDFMLAMNEDHTALNVAPAMAAIERFRRDISAPEARGTDATEAAPSKTTRSCDGD